jgi:hypothetical protein
MYFAIKSRVYYYNEILLLSLHICPRHCRLRGIYINPPVPSFHNNTVYETFIFRIVGINIFSS